MKRLICSKCGFETNAVAENAEKVICYGCFKNPQASRFKDDSYRDAIEHALREYENMPEWLKRKETQ